MPLRILYFGTASNLASFVNAAQGATDAVVVAGGTGYSTDDILDVVGGTGELIARLRVTTQAGGVITAIVVEEEGAYTTAPTNPVAVVGGTGNDDATFNLTLGDAVAQIEEITNKGGQWYLAYSV